MKKTISILVSAALVSLVATAGLFAGTRDPYFHKRQLNQQKRIVKGVKNGELTRKEVRQLERQQVRIHRAEKNMSADGQLTVRERARLEKMQNKASRNIYRKKHNERRP